MGAKDWMLMYADGDVRPLLQVPPPPDRDTTNALIARLYPGHHIVGTDDGNLFDNANPPDHYVYAEPGSSSGVAGLRWRRRSRWRAGSPLGRPGP
jgi:hypothetical protein